MSRTGYNIKVLTEQLQNIQSRFVQMQQCTGELLPQQKQLEIIATALEDLGTALEELEVANEELFDKNQQLSVAKEAVEAERWRYQQLFELTPNGYLITDKYGKIQKANSAAAKLLNISPEFLVGRCLPNYIVYSERQAFRSQLYLMCREDRVEQKWEVCLQPPNRAPFNAALTVAAERDRTGQAVRLYWLLRDITDRKRMESELRLANQRFQLAATATNAIIYDWDITKRTVDRTEGLFEVLGYLPEEAEPTLDWWKERIHPDDLPLVRTQVSTALSNGKYFAIEYRICHKNNEYLYVLDKGLIVRSYDGKTVRVVGSTININERKKAEYLAKRTADEINRIFNMVPSFVWKFCPTTTQFVYASDIISELSGISREALLENSQIWDEQVDSGYESQRAMWVGWEAIKKGEPYRIVYLFHTVHKGERWFEIVGRPAYEDGVLYYYGCTTDITERQQAEAARHESEALLRTVVTNAPIILYALDHQGVFTLCEGKGLESLGFKPGDVVGRSAFRVYHKRPDILENIRRVLGGAESNWVVDFGNFVYENRATPVRDQKGNVIGLIGVATDITICKQAQVALQETNEALEFKVEERTAALRELNNHLIFEVAERQQTAETLKRYQLLAKHTRDIVLFIDRDGKIVEANQAALIAYGYSRREFAELRIQDLRESETNALLVEQMAQAEERGILFTTTHHRKDGSTFPVEVSFQSQLVGDRRVLLSIIRDISDRQQAEEALRKSEERFRNLVETISDWVWEIDEKYAFTYVSPKVRDILGYEPEEVLGKTSFDFMSPEEAFRVANTFGPIAAQEVPFSCFEDTRIHKNRHLVTLQTSGVPIFDSSGKLRGYRGISRDVTEWKQAGEALRQSEERFRAIFEREGIGVALTTLEGRLIATNPKFQEMLGYGEDEVRGMVFTDLTYPDDITEDWELFQELVAGNLESYQLEKRYIRKNGQVVWGHLTTAIIRGAGGVPQFNIATIQDITERKQMEEALRQSEARYRAIVQDQTELICRVLPNGILSFVNEAYCRCFGLNREELVGSSFMPVILQDDRELVQAKLASLSRENPVIICENRVVMPDGKIRWQQWTNRALFDEQNCFFEIQGVGRDITERKQAEEALLQSEERFRQLAEHIDDVFWIVSPDRTQTLYVSPAYEKIWGRTCLSLYEQPNSWMDAIHLQDRARVAAFEEQQPIDYQEEYRIIRPDGSLRWIRDRAFPVKNEAGEVYRIVGIAADITGRKQIEAALQTSEERFRRIFQRSPFGITLTCPRTYKFLKINQAFCDMLGYTESELAQLTFVEITHPEDREESIRHMESEKLTEASGCSWEKRYIKKDREILWVKITATLLRDRDEEIFYTLSMIEDITQRKRAEEEIEFLQTMTKAVFESEDFHSALGVALQKVCEATGWDFGEAWIPRTDGTVLECSPAWYSNSQNLEKFRKGSEGMTFAPGIGLPGRIWASRKAEWRNDVSAESTQVYLRAELAKECGLKAALGIPIIANNNVLTVLVFYMFEPREQDERLIELISASTELGLFIQRKRAEDEVRTALEKEKELNELKSRFVSMTSHEFRTPLGTILSSAELLEHYRHKWSDEKQLTHLHRIQAAVHHMTQMLNDVLTISKAEAGKLEFKPAPLDLVQFCQQLVEELQVGMSQQHEIVFTHQCLSVSINLDEKLLRHILTNLLSNAFKYSPQGSVVRFELICQDDRAIFTIQDRGIGIPPADQKRLFESFHRATNVGNIPGTGLGLSIVKNCVDLHGGTITVDSKVEVGTTFTVTLPLSL